MSTPITPPRSNDATSARADVTPSGTDSSATRANAAETYGDTAASHPDSAQRTVETSTYTPDDRYRQDPAVGQLPDQPRAEPQIVPVLPDRATVVARQKERFGGMKIGSAFFGWLTATGMAVILISLLAAAGVAFGVATNTTVDQAVQDSENITGTAQTVGLVGAITLLVVVLLAYYCGGYVAGRMARFNGIKQGLAVWLWGVLMTLVIAAVAAIAGAQYDVFAQLNLPRLPVNEGEVTTVGAIAIGAAILAALIGALLGGLAGMRFHRKVDAAGLEPIER